jgi:hypothetical protein
MGMYMKCLSYLSNKSILMTFCIGSFTLSGYADNSPKANVNLTFVNNLNSAFVQSTSTAKSNSTDLLPIYSSVLQLEYYNANYSINVGKSISEPLKNVDGELDTSDPSLYVIMLQLPTLMVEYKHIPVNNGEYYANQQCVYAPRILNIISFTQSGGSWQPAASANQSQKSMQIQSNDSPEQSCSKFDFQYSMKVSPDASGQNEFNVDITFYIALNKNGVNVLNETNNKINQANNPDGNIW